ncbi:LysE family translocator [Parabacteroides sp. 52]|uniref:LysE family translocator n=1 Tax=unclassified Parabacteroides TaxID=2649774 RepID=UPI0013D413DD|nr:MULTISPECIES: LysE family transporter [unclassified Parabacteroides]MDH6535657.1 threonine/homoserine/homoserine lactone efflux protein [Parabacteroides sp. PM5-20]NDV56296.1 LysE family translocator [Parabacteroides sp. 52]
MIGLIGKSLLIGILVSAPMGPIGILCIQRTLNKGRWHGFITGLGAALSDVLYAAITSLALGFVGSFVESNHTLLQLFGSLVLGGFGYYIYKSNPVRNIQKAQERRLSYAQDFISAFLLTFSNVLIVLLYIGLFARFGFVKSEYTVWTIMLGVFCIGMGAVIWWFVITHVIAKLRKWFNIRGIWLMNRIVGTIIIVLSILGLLSVVFSSYFHIPLLQIY